MVGSSLFSTGRGMGSTGRERTNSAMQINRSTSIKDTGSNEDETTVHLQSFAS